MKRIIISIDDKTGETKVEADGFKGRGCQEATKFIETALGTAKNRTKKPVFYAQEGQGQHLTSKG